MSEASPAPEYPVSLEAWELPAMQEKRLQQPPAVVPLALAAPFR
jgi:hypothetical protein